MEKEDFGEEEQQINRKKRIIKRKCTKCKSKTTSKYCTECGNAMKPKKENKIQKKLDWKENLQAPRMATFLPHHLTEPIYCVCYVPPNLKPEDYHGGHSIAKHSQRNVLSFWAPHQTRSSPNLP